LLIIIITTLQCLEELKRLIQFRVQELGPEAGNIVALGLSSRKNLCIHPEVASDWNGQVVDSKCRNLTASWHREAILGGSAFTTSNNDMELVDDEEEEDNETTNNNNNDAEKKKKKAAQNSSNNSNNSSNSNSNCHSDLLCQYFEEFQNTGDKALLTPGVYTLADLKKVGKKLGWCPYFVARKAVEYANIIVHAYSYIIDPKISSIVSNSLRTLLLMLLFDFFKLFFNCFFE